VIAKVFGGWLVFAAPLWMASAQKKKKTAAKKIRRSAKKTARRSSSRKLVAHRVAGKKSIPKAPKKNTRAALKAKPPVPAPKVEDEEPLVPPVAPIGRAILLVPKEGTYVESFHPTFRWLSVGGATRYEVQWGEDATLTNKYAALSLATEAKVPVEKPLRVGVLYYWRVRGGNDGGWGPWSPLSSFRVLEETP